MPIPFQSKSFLSPFLVFVFFSPISAQDSTRTLPTVEISTQRLDRYFIGQTGSNVDTLTKQIFENQTLTQLVSGGTAIPVKSYGTGLATVTMRGMGAAQTAMLWNGFDIRSATAGLNELGIFPTGFDRISVKNGSSTALFGSGAIGGTILLDSEAPVTTDFQGKMDFSVGSFGYQGYTLQLGGGKGKVTASAQFQEQSADNDFTFTNTSAIGQPQQRQANADTKTLNALLNLRIQPKKNQLIKLSGWLQNARRGVPPSMVAADNHARQNDDAARFTGEWVSFQKKGDTRLRAAYFDEKLLYFSDAIPESRYRIHTFIGETEHTRRNFKNGLLRMGLNFTQQNAANTNYSAPKSRSRQAIFAAQIFPWRSGKAVLNLRQEWSDGKAVPFTFSLGGEQIVLKTNENRGKIALRGSFSRNFSRPSLNDLYWENVGNPNLRPENGWSEEAGIDAVFSKVKIKATVFYLNVEDWIQWAPQNNGIWRPSNLKSVQSKGMELDINWTPTVGFGQLELNGSYRLARTSDSFYPEKQLIYVPVHAVFGSITVRKNRFYGRWTQNFSSRRYSTQTNTAYTDAFALSGFFLGYNFDLWNKNCDVSFRIDNILGSSYHVIPYYPNPGRNFVVSAVCRL